MFFNGMGQSKNVILLMTESRNAKRIKRVIQNFHEFNLKHLKHSAQLQLEFNNRLHNFVIFYSFAIKTE
jgi:hypothetical protein